MCSLMQWVLNSLFFIMKWHKWNFLIGCQWCHTQVKAQVGLFPLLWTYSMTDCEFLESSCPSLVVNITLLEGLQLCFCNRIETCQCVFLSLFARGGYFSFFYYAPLLLSFDLFPQGQCGTYWVKLATTFSGILSGLSFWVVSWVVSKSTINVVTFISNS